MAETDPGKRHHVVSIPVSIVIALASLFAGSFFGPMVGDRMSVEHRLSLVEQAVSQLTAGREEDRKRMDQWGQSIRAALERMEKKLERFDDTH